MQVLLTNPTHDSILFGIVFSIALLITFVLKKNYTSFSLTQELKGFAILSIIFAHIGYYLTPNSPFLFPFSILAGVGVNMFLFLSGYGITMSQLKKDEPVLSFYTRRLLKLFIPFWIVLGILLVADFAFLGTPYPTFDILKAFFGVFTDANLYTDINSPLWYFTLIVAYYILFPLVFIKSRPWLSALFLYACVWTIVQFDPGPLSGVIGLYQVHMLAFPLGVLGAWVATSQTHLLQMCATTYKSYERYLYPLAISVLLAVAGYFAIHSNVGGPAYLEEDTSIFIMLTIMLIFLIKKRESKLLSFFGLYSYEIYLFHWPLLYRYDVFYKILPAWLATLLYLPLFILLALGLKKLATHANAFLGTK